MTPHPTDRNAPNPAPGTSRRALVVGHGSIGRRHSRLLAELGTTVAIVSRHTMGAERVFGDLGQALADWKPDYVVVASRTHEHHGALRTLASSGFAGMVLVEKPLFDRQAPIPANRFSVARVGYNLRCHPLLTRLKTLLGNDTRLATATVYVGSYLPSWRQDRDYRSSYSARKSEGGGVLRDLSHEIDYVAWLFGPWQQVTARVGRFGAIEIDSDDACTMLMETTRCPLVTVHLNYLDRVPRREVLVNTHSGTIHVDLIHNAITIDGAREGVAVERDDTYRAQHLTMLDSAGAALCTLDEGLETLATIEAAERASSDETWISR